MTSALFTDIDAPDPTAITSRHAPTLRDDTLRRWLAAAIALGVLVRVLPALSSDFPVNDGGLFYQMALEIKRAHFALPRYTSYNSDGIPFAYAPLGFYLAALIGGSPAGILLAVHWIPVIVSCLMLPAFALLATSVLHDARKVVAATFAFATLPRAFLWMVMGGGLTRAPGLLFTLLALWQAHALFTKREWRYAMGTSVFAAGVILSHLGTAPFMVASMALFFISYGRHRFGVLASVVVAALTLLLVAPWLATVIGYHGLAPFKAAQSTGGSALSGSTARWTVRITLAKLSSGITGEQLMPLIYVLGLFGALSELTARRFLLAAWWLLVVMVDIRAPGTYASIPIAMLAGVAVIDVLLPMLRRANNGGEDPVTSDVTTTSQRKWWTTSVLAGLLLYVTAAALMRTPSLISEMPFLTSLTRGDRDAMQWVATRTPPDSRVLVVTSSPWATDRIAEWFPVLANRRSVATVQGSEWLPGGVFARRYAAYEALDGCAKADIACIERWASAWGDDYSHLYVAKSVGAGGLPGANCCASVIASAKTSAHYQQIYDGPAATIFARRE